MSDLMNVTITLNNWGATDDVHEEAYVLWSLIRMGMRTEEWYIAALAVAHFGGNGPEYVDRDVPAMGLLIRRINEAVEEWSVAVGDLHE